MGSSKERPQYDWVISKENVLRLAQGTLPFVLAAASVALTVASTLGVASVWFWRLFWCALVVYAVAMALSIIVWHLDQSLHRNSQIDLAKLAALEKTVMSSLVACADQLRDAILDNPHVRITIYGYYKGTDAFIPVMRRCKNPDLQALHRSSYPRDEGIISQVWQAGSGSFECLAKNSLQKQLKQQHLARTGISGDTYDDLSMKSTSMIGVSLVRENDPCGVIVIESDSQDVNVANGLDALRSHPLVNEAARIVFDTRNMLPDLRDNQEYNTHARRNLLV